MGAAPTAPPPRAAKPSRLPFFVGAVMVVVLVAAAVAFYTSGSKEAPSTSEAPAMPDVPAIPAAAQALPSALPSAMPTQLPGSPGPVPVDPRERTTK